MIKRIFPLFAAVAALALTATSFNLAAQGSNDGYARSSAANATWKNPFGLCWRTGYWTPAMANAECDPDLMPKKAAPTPSPRPAARPAPVPPPKAAMKPKPKPVAQKITYAADVFFDFDKAIIKPAGKSKLDDLAAKIGAMNLEVVIAIGHTDSIGSDAYNRRLSVRRAEAVKAYLVSKRIAPNRIYTEGKGEKQPIASNKTREGRAKNRRTEIEVIGTRK